MNIIKKNYTYNPDNKIVDNDHLGVFWSIISIIFFVILTISFGVHYKLLGYYIGLIPLSESNISKISIINENNTINATSPVVSIPETTLQTVGKDITISIVSSRKLVTQNDNYELTLSSLPAPTNDSYRYELKIKNLKPGDNYEDLIFADENGNSINRSLIVNQMYIPEVSDNLDVKYTLNGDDLLALVDKKYSLLSTYYPKDLVNLSDYSISTVYSSMTLRKVVIDDLKKMFDDMAKEGLNVSVISAYRSYEMQIATYNYWVQSAGQAEADRSSARPGHSEHQLGTTLDITTIDVDNQLSSDFGSTEAGKWLALNSYKYGFVISYTVGQEAITGYKWEPWHFRYIGTSAAAELHQKGITLREYLYEVNDVQ